MSLRRGREDEPLPQPPHTSLYLCDMFLRLPFVVAAVAQSHVLTSGVANG